MKKINYVDILYAVGTVMGLTIALTCNGLMYLRKADEQ